MSVDARTVRALCRLSGEPGHPSTHATCADTRDELNQQIDVTGEKQVTKILSLLRPVVDHMGLEEAAEEPEVKELSQSTAAELLTRELRDRMPE